VPLYFASVAKRTRSLHTNESLPPSLSSLGEHFSLRGRRFKFGVAFDAMGDGVLNKSDHGHFDYREALLVVLVKYHATTCSGTSSQANDHRRRDVFPQAALAH